MMNAMIVSYREHIPNTDIHGINWKWTFINTVSKKMNIPFARARLSIGNIELVYTINNL